MIRIRLPEAEADRLEQASRQATDRELRDRLRIVPRAHRGRPSRENAADLAGPRTIRAGSTPPSTAASMPRGAPGRFAEGPAAPAADVRRRAIEGPGPDRADWTHAELADHLLKAQGISASR